jgi:hypothetical protein
MKRAVIEKKPDVDITIEVNKLIKALMRHYGLRQQDLANKIWMRRQNLNMRLNGRATWLLPELLCVCDVFQIDLSHLIKHAEWNVGIRRNYKKPRPLWKESNGTIHSVAS